MKVSIYIVLIFLLFTQPVKAQHLTEDFNHLTSRISPVHSETFNSSNINSAPDLFLVFYQSMISPQDNTSCPFHPNCSEFSSQAFRKESFIKGYMLTFDRLLRCNGLPGMYEYYPLDEKREHFLDPVDNYSSSE